jgi:hypothetical protein
MTVEELVGSMVDPRAPRETWSPVGYRERYDRPRTDFVAASPPTLRVGQDRTVGGYTFRRVEPHHAWREYAPLGIASTLLTRHLEGALRARIERQHLETKRERDHAWSAFCISWIAVGAQACFLPDLWERGLSKIEKI